MNYKHESAKKKPVWLLCLAAVAIVLACFALYRAIGSKTNDNDDDVKESDGTQADGDQTSGNKDGDTDSAEAKETEAIASGGFACQKKVILR